MSGTERPLPEKIRELTQLIRADQLRPQTAQTPGMIRHEALHTGKMWIGTANTQPHFVSGWHHHGVYESAIYVLAGAIRVEAGPGGKHVIEGGPGDFVWVPAGVIHRESNPSDADQTIVLVRAGQGDFVVNTDGPEPEE